MLLLELFALSGEDDIDDIDAVEGNLYESVMMEAAMSGSDIIEAVEGCGEECELSDCVCVEVRYYGYASTVLL